MQFLSCVSDARGGLIPEVFTTTSGIIFLLLVTYIVTFNHANLVETDDIAYVLTQHHQLWVLA